MNRDGGVEGMVAEVGGTIAFAFPAYLPCSAAVISLVSHVVSNRTTSRLSRAAFFQLSWLMFKVLKEAFSASLKQF